MAVITFLRESHKLEKPQPTFSSKVVITSNYFPHPTRECVSSYYGSLVVQIFQSAICLFFYNNWVEDKHIFNVERSFQSKGTHQVEFSTEHKHIYLDLTKEEE